MIIAIPKTKAAGMKIKNNFLYFIIYAGCSEPFCFDVTYEYLFNMSVFRQYNPATHFFRFSTNYIH